jgi:peptidoglycan/LPS O-acetylase OafA/YrhL
MTSASAFSDSKKHLLILDGLRGVAAIMVLIHAHLSSPIAEATTIKCSSITAT